ncbi:MAG: zinc finger domain-containing protein [Candidatus Nitrosocaldus sp.]
MSQRAIALPSCISCNRVIMPNDRCVKFNCPKCNRFLIWRCESCREFARMYKCKECGFEGP